MVPLGVIGAIGNWNEKCRPNVELWSGGSILRGEDIPTRPGLINWAVSQK